MKKTLFHKIYSLMLIIALAFGQVGAGFLHNKHDAHETVLDLDHTVLVNHGEHCKVCAVDWVHQFIAESFLIEIHQEQKVSFLLPGIVESPDPSPLFIKGRAPPVA